MIREPKAFAFLSVLLASSLCLGACGDDDGGESGELSGDRGGEPGMGGASGGKSASTGGKAAMAPAGDCKPPADALEHCYAENGDREGTATCSEYYQAGLAMLFCTAPEAGGCPESDELNGACIGGLTSSYYYADSANAGFWVAAKPGCEVNGGSWCE